MCVDMRVWQCMNAQMRTDTCVDVRIDMFVVSWVDTCMDMTTDMRIGRRSDISLCMNMRVGTCGDVH